jgi:TonB family protein
VIAAWIVYTVGIGALVGLATYALERGGAWRLPVRWLWAAALAGTIAIPLLSRLLPSDAFLTSSREAGADGATAGIGEFAVLAASGREGNGRIAELVGTLAAADPYLLVLWGAATFGLLAAWFRAGSRLRRAEQGWEAGCLSGEPVRISDSMGPAVIGFVRQRIVVPRWVMHAPLDQQRIILAHEREHLRSGDHRLVLIAGFVVCLVPWNLAMWWMLRRLRLAVEIDCDARVIRGGVDRRQYGSVLIEVGARRSTPLLAVTSLTESRSLLERRIEMITRGRDRSRIVSLAAATTAAVVLGVACSIDQPQGPAPTAPVAVEEVVPAGEAADAEPRFTPYEVRPELRNAAEIRSIIEATYPPVLRDAGIGGTAVFWIHVNPEGNVTDTRLRTSSGRFELDEAAKGVMRRLRFAPALNQGEPVAVWIQLPVRYEVAPAEAMESPASVATVRPDRAPATVEAVTAADTDGGDGPVFTPYNVAPELLNRHELAGLLEREYPPLLRQAGIGGTTLLWVLIGTEGEVVRTRIHESSGQTEIDAAAERFLRQARFAPARMNDRAVAVWIQLPVTFSPRQSADG